MSRHRPRPLLPPLLLLAALTACGEDEPADRGQQRVGEPCAASDDCQEGLLCLATERRCVVLCDQGSDDCGEGIDCQPAGELGFCPLPPP